MRARARYFDFISVQDSYPFFPRPEYKYRARRKQFNFEAHGNFVAYRFYRPISASYQIFVAYFLPRADAGPRRLSREIVFDIKNLRKFAIYSH